MDSYRIQSSPKKLLFVTTGNIRNKDLISLFEKKIDLISEAFQKYTLVELSIGFRRSSAQMSAV